MPNIVLKWKEEHYESNPESYSKDAAWIFEVRWRRSDDDRVLLPANRGLYIIEETATRRDNVKGPVYAGQADNFDNRFKGRSGVLREFRLAEVGTNPVATRIVRLADVSRGDADLNVAERWLVRILYLADAAHILQNIDKTGPYQVPDDGLDVQILNPPSYLKEDYNYPAGTII